jgi:Flp pilus assembly protein TadG
MAAAPGIRPEPGAPKRRGRARARRRERGTALIEFGLVLPFLFVVTLTVVDLSRAFYLKSMITAAARQGVRVAIVQSFPTSADGSGPITGAGFDSVYTRVSRVLQYTGMPLAVSDVQAYRTYGNPTPGAAVDSVRVQTQFNWLYLGLFGYLGSSSITNPQTLTATAVMRKEG